ncbi:MAG: hypothetical protein ACXIUD_12895 [Mongoliitalea sp.]
MNVEVLSERVDVPIESSTIASSKAIPTYVYASVFASFCIAVGLIWDISWHMTVGRDGLFSPPHLAIYLGALIAGLFSGFNVLKISFWGSRTEKAASIKFWGIFYASLGALFCIWGALAMLTSAPFDDWWHNTYGLDVKILSPPHALLGLGMIIIQFGALISVSSLQNRKHATLQVKERKHLEWMYALSSGFLLVMLFVIGSEYFFPYRLRMILPYQIAATLFPFIIIAVAYAAPYRWAATKMTAVYTILMAAMVWILPLFSAEPLLSPVHNPVTRMQPYLFPLLFIVPAMAMDLLIMKKREGNKWVLAVLLGLAFISIFTVVHWYFSAFLLSEPARGWFFGRFSWPYYVNPESPYRFAFYEDASSHLPSFVKGMGIALLLAILSSRLGISLGSWMKEVKR